MTLKILEHFDLLKYFDFVAAATLDGLRSRKEDVISWAIEKLEDKDRDGIVMVGDRENDIFGAMKNGIDSIGVLYGYGPKEELTAAKATYLAASPEEVVRIIREKDLEKTK